MKLYHGCRSRDGGDALVEIIGEDGIRRRLNARLDIANLSDEAFDWGNSSMATSQLAVAILADALGGKPARQHYSQFKWDKLLWLRADSWTMDSDQVLAWMRARADSRSYQLGGQEA